MPMFVITDCWTSMGQEEEEKIREKAFAGYQVNKELMGVAKTDAMVLHCLPAYREQENHNRGFRGACKRKFSTKRKTDCMHRRQFL